MQESGALIKEIIEESPADDVGFVPGCRILSVDGQPLRDMIDWRWYADGETVSLSYLDTDGEQGTVELDRELGEDWGIVFEGAIFDGVKSCRNNCTFCFIKQMPQGVRNTLAFKDDDFRLCFFEGTFVTFTNVSEADEARIKEQCISPLRMSVHAITPSIRQALIGPHEKRGIEVCERLLAAGIELHLQIVLLPGVNDGEELVKTLSWAYGLSGVRGVGIVPLGFTKFQSRFSRSFNEPTEAQKVIDTVVPFQNQALHERNQPWVYLADEFYRNAYPVTLLEKLPSTEHYGEFELFEDGIGIIRTTVDSWHESTDLINELATLLEKKKKRVHLVIGEAQQEFIVPLIANSVLSGKLIPCAVKNEYFGGNVDVTGLLCGEDIVRSLNKAVDSGECIDLAVLPKVIFNVDQLSLDDMTLEEMKKMSEVPLAVVSCNPSDYLAEIIALLR